MMPRRLSVVALGAALCTLLAPPAGAQSLADRVSSGNDGAIAFSFAARPGVCGNGRSFVSIGSNTYIGSYNMVDGAVRESCEAGLARVIVSRAGPMITSIETYVGSPTNTAAAPTGPAARDLGRVPSREAAAYLLSRTDLLKGLGSMRAVTSVG